MTLAVATVLLNLKKSYKIGDYVWEDVDKDGVQGTDSKEKPMANVLVTLTYPDGTTKSVRTDANGHYEFGGLKDGETYTVKFETPAGYLPTKENGTTDGEKDSNGSSVTVKINGKDDMSLDTGFIKNLNIILVTMYGKIQIKMVSKMLMNLVSKMLRLH